MGGYWDPLGLGKDGDADVFRRRREVEIKHGRVCMIATIGFMVTSVGYRFPGELSPSTGITFEKVPAGLDAIGAVPALGWVQIFVFSGLIDTGLFRADPARDPGDFENGGILGVPNASGPMSDAEGRKWKTGNGGHHGHAFPKWLGGILRVRDVGFLNSSHRGTGYGGILGSRDVGFLNGAQQRQWLYISKKDVTFTCRCGTDN